MENNTELWNKWMKTTWKTFEETIRRDRNTSIWTWRDFFSDEFVQDMWLWKLLGT